MKNNKVPIWVDADFKKILQHSMIERGYRSMPKFTRDLVSTPEQDEKRVLKKLIEDGKENRKNYFLKF